MRTNEFGQAIGDALPNFTPGRLPAIERIEGRYTVIERLSKEKHGADLYQVYGPASPADMWTFLFKGPAHNEAEWDRLLDDLMTAQGRFYYAIVDKDSGKALGTFSLMRIDQANRVIEVGAVTYSPALKKTRMATEAQYLLARYVFEDLGYRRYEWKCDALNQASRKQLSAWDSPMKAVSARLLFIKVGLVIQTGCPSLTKNGQLSKSASKLGWIQVISMKMANKSNL